MTYENLKNEVAALGFEAYTDSEEFVLFAVNRAQKMIGADFPIEESYTLYQTVTEPRFLYRQAPASLSLTGGCAISFRCLPGGSLHIKSKSKNEKYAFSENKLVYQFNITEDTVLSFSGVAFDLAVYDSVYASALSIPVYYDMISYALKDVLPRYICLLDEPRDELGRQIAGAITEGDLLLLPRHYQGHVRLRYRRCEREITKEEKQVDVHPGAAVLLPLLSAAYLWLEDEPEKAQYYMSLYREGVVRLRGGLNASTHAGYEDVLGWA